MILGCADPASAVRVYNPGKSYSRVEVCDFVLFALRVVQAQRGLRVVCHVVLPFA